MNCIFGNCTCLELQKGVIKGEGINDDTNGIAGVMYGKSYLIQRKAFSEI